MKKDFVELIILDSKMNSDFSIVPSLRMGVRVYGRAGNNLKFCLLS